MFQDAKEVSNDIIGMILFTLTVRDQGPYDLSSR
jgi:hypothetical protein